ncbi:unnamed protein product [Linum trigynum]|uniref:Uncharacterized protein n=1 Tax=Linum trigynum TaxID=586398 RepID=A0AAV2EVI9_9ROSI
MEDGVVAFRDDFHTVAAIAVLHGGDCPKHSNRRISASSQSPPPMLPRLLATRHTQSAKSPTSDSNLKLIVTVPELVD